MVCSTLFLVSQSGRVIVCATVFIRGRKSRACLAGERGLRKQVFCFLSRLGERDLRISAYRSAETFPAANNEPGLAVLPDANAKGGRRLVVVGARLFQPSVESKKSLKKQSLMSRM